MTMAKTSSPQFLEPGGNTGSSSSSASARSMAEKSRDQLEQEIRELQQKVQQAEQALRSVEERLRKHKVQNNRMAVTMRLKLQRQEEMIRGLRKEREKLMGYITSHLLFVEGALRREQKQIQRLLAEKDQLLDEKSKEISTLKVTVFGGPKDDDATPCERWGEENIANDPTTTSALASVLCSDHADGGSEVHPRERATGHDARALSCCKLQAVIEEEQTAGGVEEEGGSSCQGVERTTLITVDRTPEESRDAQRLPASAGPSTPAGSLPDRSVRGPEGEDGGDHPEPEINPRVLQLHGSYERLTDLGRKGVKATSGGPSRAYLTNHRSVTRPRDVKCRRQVARFRSRPTADGATTVAAAVGIARSVVLSL